MFRLLCALFLLGGCAIPDVAYVVDGVPVICEQGYGPPQGNMQHAAEIYRSAARERFELPADDETVLWRGIRGIRWMKRPVAGYAEYDAGTRMVNAMWLGCVVNAPVYRAFADHYLGDSIIDDDVAWAAQLERDSAESVCTLTYGKKFNLW